MLGQLKFTIRRNYSSPPIHGGQIVATVLTDPALRSAWAAELDAMRTRILSMRQALHAVLRAKMPGRDFDYFLTQRGMFSYTGLSPAQVDRLREQHGVYVIRSGRLCVAGLNTPERRTDRAGDGGGAVAGIARPRSDRFASKPGRLRPSASARRAGGAHAARARWQRSRSDRRAPPSPPEKPPRDDRSAGADRSSRR